MFILYCIVPYVIYGNIVDVRIDANFPCDADCQKAIDIKLPIVLVQAETIAAQKYVGLSSENSFDVLIREPRFVERDIAEDELCKKTTIR